MMEFKVFSKEKRVIGIIYIYKIPNFTIHINLIIFLIIPLFMGQ